MILIKLTRDILPNLPDEVFEMFIVPQNDAPLNIFDSKPGGRWFFHFGGISIKEFSNLRWRRSALILNENILHPDSYSDIYRLIAYCNFDSAAMARALFPGYPSDSKARLIWHKEFIKKTGRLCAPIIVIGTNNGIRVLDGTHRLAALFSIRTHNSMPFDA